MRSSAVISNPSAVGTMFDKCSRKVSATPLGAALVPEVKKMTASSLGPTDHRPVSLGLQLATAAKNVPAAGRSQAPSANRGAATCASRSSRPKPS